MKKWISCFLLTYFAVYGESVLDQELPFTDVEKGLPTIVAGCVNVINGDYIDQETDIQLQAPIPLSFGRFYSSADYTTRSFFCGWRYNHDRHVKLIKSGSDSYSAISTEHSGRSGAFKGKASKLKYEFDKRMTNCGSGAISARTNIKNASLSLNNREIETKQPNGDKHTLKYYKKHILECDYYYDPSIIDHMIDGLLDRRTEVESYHITHLKTMNGPQLHYSYDDENQIKQIKATDESGSIVFGSLDFEKKEKDPSHGTFHVKGSDGNEVVYNYEAYNERTRKEKSGGLKKRFHVTRAAFSNAPVIRYYYKDTEKNHEEHITWKVKPEKRFLNICYYDTWYIGKSDKKIDRVRCLKAPVGTTSKGETTHTFNYNLKPGKRASKYKYHGYTAVIDANGNRTHYEYDKDERLKNVVKFKKGSKTDCIVNDHYVWDGKSQIVAHNVKDSQRTHASRQFQYDSYGSIISEKLYGIIKTEREENSKVDRDHLAKEASDCYTKRYSYTTDQRHLLRFESDSAGLRVEYQHYPGTDLVKAKFVYDDKEIKTRYFFQYDPIYRTLTQTIKDDGCTKQPHNLEGVTQRSIERVTPIAPAGLPHIIEEKFLNLKTKQEELLKKTVLHYTTDGKVAEKAIYDSRNEYCYSLFWEYDKHGNILVEKDALGRATHRQYDKNDNLIKEQTEGRNYHREYLYDFSNRCVSEIVVVGDEKFVSTYSYDFLGNRTKTQDLNGNVTHYQYDELGRVAEVKYPKIPDVSGTLTRGTETFSYDVFNSVISHTDTCGLITEKKNNILGQPLSITYPDQTTEKLCYTVKGKLAKKREKNGREVTYKYDFLGRLLEDENKIYRYNAFHLLTETDREGGVTHFEYDFAGRLVSEKKEGRVKTYEYDTLGNKSVVKEWIDQNHYLAHHKKYDFLGQIVEEKTLDEAGNIFSITTYEYDSDGNCSSVKTGDTLTRTAFDFQKRPIRIEDALGQTTHIEYQYGVFDQYGVPVLRTITTAPSGHQTHVWKNSLNHEAKVEIFDPFGELLSRKEMFYNGKGELLHVKESVIEQGEIEKEIIYAWEYSRGNLVRLTEALGSREQKITTHEYNQAGEKISTTLPNGDTFYYEYDEKGRLSRFHTEGIDYTYNYNNHDHPTLIRDRDKATKRKYNLFGQITQEKLANGHCLGYEYDLRGRLTRFSLPDGSAIRYIYDAAHLRKIERYSKDNDLLYTHENRDYNQTGELLEAILPGNGGKLTYSYDALSRPLEVSHDLWKQQVEAYDLSGNMTATNENSYKYDGLNQLIEENGHAYRYDSLNNRREKDGKAHLLNEHNQIVNDGLGCYRYDRNGNMIDDGERQYEYDALNRLTKVTNNGDHYYYTYDAFNRRMSKRSSGGTLNYLYMQQSEVGSLDENNELLEFRVLCTPETEIGSSVAFEINKKSYIPLQNVQGHVVSLLDMESGEKVESITYTAYGERDQESLSPWGYSGKRWDAESGLVYFGQRYYLPKLGRFLTPDPSGFADGANLYAYARNNPLSYVDHFGLASSNLWHLAQALFFALFNEIAVSASVNSDGNVYLAPKTGPFELFGPPRELSVTVKHEGAASQKQNRAGVSMFHNGVMNDDDDFIKSHQYLEKLSGGVPVIGLHHRTCFKSGLLDDFLRYFTHFFSGRMSTASKDLLSNWTNYCKNNPGKRILQFCHSEGAVHVRNALRNSPPEIRNQIDVVVIAGGAYIDKKLAGSVMHYCSSRDIVPHVDWRGRQMAKQQGTLRVLQPAHGTSLNDHSFNSPTFQRAIQTEYKSFRGKNV